MSEAAPDEPAAWIEKFEHRWVAAWNNHDAAALVHLCHPAIEWSDSAARRVLRGRVQVQERIAQTLVMFPDVRFEPVTLYVDPRGAGAAVWWRMYATFLGPMDPPGFAPTGRRVRCDGVDFWRFQDGLCAAVRRCANELMPPTERFLRTNADTACNTRSGDGNGHRHDACAARSPWSTRRPKVGGSGAPADPVQNASKHAAMGLTKSLAFRYA
jgi:hypothetical protein